MDILFVPGKTALATATVGINLSLRSFKCFMTFRASDFPAEMSWLCSPRVSINSECSVMAVARIYMFNILSKSSFR